MDASHKRSPLKPETITTFVEVRGPSGRLYGRLNPLTMQMEFFDRRTREKEVVDLSLYQQRQAVS